MAGGGGEGAAHVLVVEDDPGVRWAMGMALEMSGYRVSSAADLAQALERARAEPGIGFLVVDYNLPNGERGTEVVRAAREILGAGVAALLLTGDTSDAAREAARTSGLRLARKPIELDELLGILRGFG
jgi:DNA-binding response OmpR family regulator